MLSSTKAEIALTRRPGRNWLPVLTSQRSSTSTSHLRRTVSLGIRSALAREPTGALGQRPNRWKQQCGARRQRS